MSYLEDNAKILCDFGLTPYQAKVYLAVVQLSLASISKISKFSKIRREEVYRTLPNLEKAGLIDRVLGKPLKVRALPVEDALSILIERKKEEANREISELAAKKSDFLKNFKANSKKIMLEEEKPNFVLISEKDAMVKRIASLIKNAEREIDIVDSRGNVARLAFSYIEPLKKALKNKVKVRIISELPDDEDIIPISLEKYFPGNSFDLKYVEDLPSCYIIVDNKETIIASGAADIAFPRKNLWTNDPSLVGLLQRNFEDLFHSSVDWKTLIFSPSEKINRIVNRLRPTDHAIFVYDYIETKHDFLFSYIRTGLENNEAAAYVCSEENPNQIREAMKQFGIEVEKHERAGALTIIHYTDLYIIDGKFNITKVLDSWNKLYREALTKGFKGLRVTGEMECFFKHNLTKELVEYEDALHRVLDLPIVAICAYNANILNRSKDPVNIYSELVKAHGTVLFTAKDNKLGTIEIRKA